MKEIASRHLRHASIVVMYDEEQGVSGKYEVFLETTGSRGLESPGPITVKISKVFDSETAWSDAERYANDLIQRYKTDHDSTNGPFEERFVAPINL